MIRNDTILVADSGQWRVVEIRRTSSGWEPIWVLNTAGGKHLKWPRDADRLPNGNTLITDCKNNRVIEVTKNGTIVLEQSFDRIPYEADRHPYKEPRDVPRYNSSTSPATEKATLST